MRLSFEEVGKAVSGHVRYWEREDGFIEFSRFTESQEEYQVLVKDRPRQPHGTAGMLLEAEGNISAIRFAYQFAPGSSRQVFSFTVMENGETTEVVKRTGELTGSGFFEYVPKQSGRLTVVFPYLYNLMIRDVEIEGDWQFVKRKRKLFIAGDSITQGYDAWEPQNAYTHRIMDAMDGECVNQAIGGDRFDVNNLNDMPDFEPDVVIINYGTNDWSKEENVLVTADAYLKRLSELFPNAARFEILPIWRAMEGIVREHTGWTVNDVREIIRDIAMRYGFTVIPGLNLVPHDPELFSDHSLHPNDAGFSYYADNVIRELRMRAPELFL